MDLIVALRVGIGITTGSGRERPADGSHLTSLEIAATVFLDSFADN